MRKGTSQNGKPEYQQTRKMFNFIINQGIQT